MYVSIYVILDAEHLQGLDDVRPVDLVEVDARHAQALGRRLAGADHVVCL